MSQTQNVTNASQSVTKRQNDLESAILLQFPCHTAYNLQMIEDQRRYFIRAECTRPQKEAVAKLCHTEPISERHFILRLVREHFLSEGIPWPTDEQDSGPTA